MFKREGDDIVVEVPITFDEAVLGGKVEVPTITGRVFATVPPGSNTGQTLRLKGRGIKRKGGKPGDELVKLSGRHARADRRGSEELRGENGAASTATIRGGSSRSRPDADRARHRCEGAARSP